MSLLNKKSICIITGASRGIGEGMALKFAEHLGSDSALVLLARNVTDLGEVQKKVLALPEAKAHNIKVAIQKFDQGSTKKEDFDSIFPQVFEELKMSAADFKQAIMIHNAGTLDQTIFCKALDNLELTSLFFQINMSGMVTLNAKFLQVFPTNQKVVINISSLAGVQAFRSWGLYCSVKSARDMFFKVLALEEPEIRVLNYAPGPVRTDMMTKVTKSEDKEISEIYANMDVENKLLTPEMTSNKLIQILEKNKFENGSHIDYYDEI